MGAIIRNGRCICPHCKDASPIPEIILVIIAFGFLALVVFS